MTKRTAVVVWAAVFMVINLVCWGIWSSEVRGEGQPDGDLSSIRVEKIAVMPFFKGKYGGSITENLECSVCQFTYDQSALDPDADYILSLLVQEELAIRFGDRAVPFALSREVFEKIPKDDSTDTIQNLAKRLGPALNANLIVAGNVWKYKERVGSPGAIQSPASVGFAVYLIEPAGGKLLWKSTFSETQKSLFENVLNAKAFFNTGGNWLTARELAQYGVGEVFKEFPLR